VLKYGETLREFQTGTHMADMSLNVKKKYIKSTEVFKAIDSTQRCIIRNNADGILMKGDVCASVRYRTLHLLSRNGPLDEDFHLTAFALASLANNTSIHTVSSLKLEYRLYLKLILHI